MKDCDHTNIDFVGWSYWEINNKPYHNPSFHCLKCERYGTMIYEYMEWDYPEYYRELGY